MTIDHCKGMFLSISTIILVTTLAGCSTLRNAPIPGINLSMETTQSIAAPTTPRETTTRTTTPTATSTPAPTYTLTLTASFTPAPPIEGKLFFDMNGSGLQDEATFQYDPVRLADPRQPLQPDLDKAIDDYLSTHPNMQKRDLITLQEPALTNYTVCIDENCAITSNEGVFSISYTRRGATANLKITDPYGDHKALAMRYFREFVGQILFPAHQINELDIPEQPLFNSNRLSIKEGINIDLS